ncbi:speedy protein E4-like [Ochotona curzoniae]|uniref:speedy protein E4-like n=1 Tax=Ochotona curzoniae TaxID=130825 RepID=UPI001B346325|nr:speedy protein E4-like [Ochotona curzoniae]
MASCEPDPQIEDCPLEALVDDEVPGPPDEGPEGAAFSISGSDSETEVTPVLQGHQALDLQGEQASQHNPKALIKKRTRPKESWAVEWLLGLKMRLKKQRVSTVLPEHHKVFNRLLEDPVVKQFLAWDKQLRVSDKYLLAMVVAYLGRAGLFSWQYRRIHFFVALYLANDMEEDEEDDEPPKQAILSFLFGKDDAQRPLFDHLRLQFMRCMGWKAWVTLEECEEIQAYDPELWVWGRDRALLA